MVPGVAGWVPADHCDNPSQATPPTATVQCLPAHLDPHDNPGQPISTHIYSARQAHPYPLRPADLPTRSQPHRQPATPGPGRPAPATSRAIPWPPDTPGLRSTHPNDNPIRFTTCPHRADHPGLFTPAPTDSPPQAVTTYPSNPHPSTVPTAPRDGPILTTTSPPSTARTPTNPPKPTCQRDPAHTDKPAQRGP